jgi:deoxyribose-phosphate aldolase
MELIMMSDVQEIMKMVDHSLLSPALTDQQLIDGCQLASKYHTASVCVKPYHVKLASECLRDSDVLVGGVIGFPHGNSTIKIKASETEQIIEDGAVEVDMVVNVGKVLSEDWEYVIEEVKTIRNMTRKHNTVLKVIFENDLLPDDRYKIKLCQICTEHGVDFVKTSTGYNYLKGPDGKYDYEGATMHDLKLMVEHTSPPVQVKAAGHSGTFDVVMELRKLGVTRTGTGQTVQLYQDAVKFFGSDK